MGAGDSELRCEAGKGVVDGGDLVSRGGGGCPDRSFEVADRCFGCSERFVGGGSFRVGDLALIGTDIFSVVAQPVDAVVILEVLEGILDTYVGSCACLMRQRSVSDHGAVHLPSLRFCLVVV